MTKYYTSTLRQAQGDASLSASLAGASRIAMRKGTTLYYLLSDHASTMLNTSLGSTSLTLNSSGSKIAELRYKACPLRFAAGVLRDGETRYTSGTTPTTYQFTSQRNETSLGLYFYREASRRDNARWYDPSLGRFTRADTLVPAGVQGYDRYAYTGNNPVRYTDSTGHRIDKGEGGCTKPIKGRCSTIAIDVSFTDEEEALIIEVLYTYAQSLGGYDSLESNLALTEINQDWVDPRAYAFYDPQTQSITLPFGWYSDAIYSNTNGTFTISMAPPDFESLLGFPPGSLPTDEVTAQFILAHEMSHAFEAGNPEAFSSFSENVDLPWAAFAGFSSNPLISRNAGRPGFADEVFSDVMAASLYSPGLLNPQMSDWIQMIMPSMLQ